MGDLLLINHIYKLQAQIKIRAGLATKVLIEVYKTWVACNVIMLNGGLFYLKQ